MLRFRHHFIAFALPAALLLSGPATGEESAATTAKPLFTSLVRTTAYTHTEPDHIPYGNKSAFGTVLKYTSEYHSAAADWSKFPLGTKFKIRGYDRIFVVDDYGGALVGSRTIDLYFPDRKRMNNWGARWVHIDVIEFGSYETSFRILCERGKHPHCLAMMAALMKVDWNRVGNGH